jgi:hypothetical protein
LADELTVRELMGLLEDQPVDAIVRVVHQPGWPLQEVVGGVANSGDIVDEEYSDPPADDGDDIPVVYLVANGRPENDRPYGPRGAWDAMRRGW